MTDNNDYFFHAGKKGMKWGVRNDPKTSADSRHYSDLKKKRLNQMSNDDLQKYNKRTELESKYRKANPSIYKKGKQAGKAALALGTTAMTVYSIVNSPVGKATIAAGKAAVRNSPNIIVSDLAKFI